VPIYTASSSVLDFLILIPVLRQERSLELVSSFGTPHDWFLERPTGLHEEESASIKKLMRA
jgi:hypothetical protein